MNYLNAFALVNNMKNEIVAIRFQHYAKYLRWTGIVTMVLFFLSAAIGTGQPIATLITNILLGVCLIAWIQSFVLTLYARYLGGKENGK